METMTKKKVIAFMSFMTRASLESREMADRHLEIWSKHLPSLSAKTFLDEYDKRHSIEGNPQQFYELWASQMISWNGLRSCMDGVKSAVRSFRHGTLRIYTNAKVNEQAQYIEFMKEWAVVSEADLATLVVHPEEVPEPERTLGNFYAVQLPKGLPAVPWAACFGKPYIEMFSREKLNASPFAVREWLSDDLVYCQLTENCFDYVNNHSMYVERQEAVMQTLGRDCFRDAVSPNKRVRVPVFPGLEIPAPAPSIPFPPAIALSDSKREL